MGEEGNSEQGLTMQLQELKRQLKELQARQLEGDALRVSQERLKTVLDAVKDGITFSDEKGYFEIYNTEMERLTGYSHLEANASGDLNKLIYPDPADSSRAMKGLADLMKYGDGHQVESSIKTKGGKRKDLLVSTTLISYGGRNMFLSAYRDITKLKRVERALTKARDEMEQRVRLRTIELTQANVRMKDEIVERKRVEGEVKHTLSLLGSILESTADGILVVDREGMIVSHNKRFAEMWDVPDGLFADACLKEVFKHVTPALKDPEAVQAVFNAIYDGTGQAGFDVIEFSDGRVFEHYSIPQRLEGETVGRVLNIRDVTERRQMEEELVRTRKLESAGIMAGGIAHDFNNLLTAVLGNISLAKKQVKADAKVTERLSLAEKASLRVRDLTYQLMTFAKGERPPTKMSYPAGKLIKEAAAHVGAGTEYEFSFSVPPDDITVQVDVQQVSQVLVNMLKNAVEAMPGGGTVAVAVDEADVTEDDGLALAPGRYVRISIADQGVGIEGDVLPKIFDPYFSTKPMGSRKGIGLGLAISYSVIRNHGGLIAVQSAPGEGSTFIIYLPPRG